MDEARHKACGGGTDPAFSSLLLDTEFSCHIQYWCKVSINPWESLLPFSLSLSLLPFITKKDNYTLSKEHLQYHDVKIRLLINSPWPCRWACTCKYLVHFPLSLFECPIKYLVTSSFRMKNCMDLFCQPHMVIKVIFLSYVRNTSKEYIVLINLFYLQYKCPYL